MAAVLFLLQIETIAFLLMVHMQSCSVDMHVHLCLTPSPHLFQYVYSKGTVLEKTVEYIKELITQNEQLTATAKLAEKSASALHVLQNQITVLEKENVFLRTQMIQCGLETTGVLSARNILSSPLAHSLLNTAQAQVSSTVDHFPIRLCITTFSHTYFAKAGRL